MSAKDKRDKIRDRLQGKNVFLVEGDDDNAAFLILLERFLPGWEQRWEIEAAGNKRLLLELLKLEPKWLGLVDRDEWDDKHWSGFFAKKQGQDLQDGFLSCSSCLNVCLAPARPV